MGFFRVLEMLYLIKVNCQFILCDLLVLKSSINCLFCITLLRSQSLTHSMKKYRLHLPMDSGILRGEHAIRNVDIKISQGF